MAKKKNNNQDDKATKKIQKKREIDRDTLENTMKIRVDIERLEDSESLDTSFLEGRIHKKVQNSVEAKEKILKEKKEFHFPIPILKTVFMIVLLAGIIFMIYVVAQKFSNDSNTVVPEDEVVQKEEKIIDSNYLFVGDYHTQSFDFDKFDLDYHYVKVGEDSFTTKDLLDDLKKYVYDYNPSIVFLQVGMNDLLDNRENDDVLNDLKIIIKEIIEHRPYANIYIESIYPINPEVDDFDDDYKDIEVSTIEDFNTELKELCDTLKVNYLNVYNELSEDSLLKEKYTDDGISLNTIGYERLYKIIRDVIDKG
jgi:hypothetical protein